MTRFLIDTNVMLAASAFMPGSGVSGRAMPEEIELRERVYEWLVCFEKSDDRIVMDDIGLVRKEYDRNLLYRHPQEYGILMLQDKADRNQVDHVPIETLEANGEHIACLVPDHECLVKDREDRKWVACALSAKDCLGEIPAIVYAAETDWFVSEEQLKAIGLCFKRLLPDDWYERKVVRR